MPDLILVLGGTAEGRALAAALPHVVYSLAGRVADPLLPEGAEVRIGGFGGFDGFVVWLRDRRPTSVVDATHPFAQQMSKHAVEACGTVGVPLLRLQRPGWSAGPGDRWTRVASLAAAAEALPALGSRPLLTTGQDLAPFAKLTGTVVARMVSEPSGPRPPDLVTVLGRPPWSLADERAVLAAHEIDVLVTKDSGGPTAAKLIAAREAGIPVVVVDRPPVLAEHVVGSVDEALAWLRVTSRLAAWITAHFASDVADQVLSALRQLPAAILGGQDSERVLAALVLPCDGQWSRFAANLALARTDWRDALVAGGLANADWPARLDTALGQH